MRIVKRSNAKTVKGGEVMKDMMNNHQDLLKGIYKYVLIFMLTVTVSVAAIVIAIIWALSQ